MKKPKPNRRVPGKDRPKKGKAEGKSGPRSGLARDIAAVVLLALAVGIALSLVTFSSVDGALMARSVAPTNLVGPVGHLTASGLLHVLGFGALVLPAALATVAWRLFRGAPARINVVAATAYSALVLSTAALAQLAPPGEKGRESRPASASWARAAVESTSAE